MASLIPDEKCFTILGVSFVENGSCCNLGFILSVLLSRSAGDRDRAELVPAERGEVCGGGADVHRSLQPGSRGKVCPNEGGAVAGLSQALL